MIELFSNFAASALAVGIGSGDATLNVASAAAFPAMIANGQFRVVVRDSAISTPEIMLVTGVSGNTFTVQRGYEGSTASAHVANALVAHIQTASLFAAVWRNGRIVNTASDSFGATDGILEVNQSGGACAIIGPSSPVLWAKEWTLKDGGFNADTNPITLTPAAGMLIDGLPSFLLNQKGQAITFYFNGTDLRIKA
jgi:hypothetical protein